MVKLRERNTGEIGKFQRDFSEISATHYTLRCRNPKILNILYKSATHHNIALQKSENQQRNIKLRCRYNTSTKICNTTFFPLQKKNLQRKALERCRYARLSNSATQ